MEEEQNEAMKKIDADKLAGRIERLYNSVSNPTEKAVLLVVHSYVQEAIEPEHRCKECKYFERDYTAAGLRGDCTNTNRQEYRNSYYRNRRQGNEPACKKYFDSNKEESK